MACGSHVDSYPAPDWTACLATPFKVELVPASCRLGCQSLLSQTLHFQSLTHKAVQWRQGFRPEDQLEGQDSLICIHHVKNKRYSACPITEYSRCGQPLLCFTACQDVLASVLRKTLHEYIGNKSKKLGGPPLLRGNEWNLISSFCVEGEHSGSLLTSELAALMVHGSGG